MMTTIKSLSGNSGIGSISVWASVDLLFLIQVVFFLVLGMISDHTDCILDIWILC